MPVVDWEVRRIRHGEGRRLREVRLRALTDAPWAFASTFDAEVGRPADEWEKAAASRAAGTDAATFVAEGLHGWMGLVGTFRATDPRGVFALVSLWVAPEHRRLGVGHRLISEVLDWARANGGTSVELWVNRDNGPAITLYRRAGFVATADYQPFPSDPRLEELRMILDLGRGAQ